MTIRVKPSKYRAKPVVIDGIRFASQKEGRRYQELKLLEKAGEVSKLQLQPRFQLCAPRGMELVRYDADDNSTMYVIGEYRADFGYWDRRERAYLVEDVKGFKTPLYKWKRKHVMAQYGITIREV